MANSTIADRIKEARVKAKFHKAADALRVFSDWKPSTYYGWENGSRTPEVEELQTIARRYNVSLEWLIAEKGDVERQYFAVPVVGLIGAGGSIDTMSEQVSFDSPIYEIEVSFELPEDALALEVRGESMHPRYDNGDVIICRRAGSDVERLLGYEAAVATDEGNRYLKTVLRGSKPGLFDLESHNAPLRRDQKLSWASPVEHVVRAGRWRAAQPRQLRA